MKLPLRPYQTNAVKLFRDRLVLKWGTSAGKCLGAIAIAESVGAKRILVVSPAKARPTWIREFKKWADRDAHPILWGRTRQLSGPKSAIRDAAYAADIQVVSYDLIHHMSADPHDLVILDEIHNLGQPLSKQSKTVRAYFKANPGVKALGLTATLIPTEVRQVWHPIDLFWPGWYGKPQKTGAESWKFLDRFTIRVENEYGTRHFGARAENLEELRALLAPKIHEVTEAEYAQYLPPLNAECLYLDKADSPVNVAEDWVRDLSDEVTHAAVICYKRDTADNLQDMASDTQTRPVFLVTGAQTPEQRDAVLQACRESPRGLLVATSESVKEAVSLSFAKQALILEWRTSPGVAEQLLGRFPRPDSQSLAPTYVQYAVMPGDEARAEQLTERIAAVRAVMQTGQKSDLLEKLFQPRELSDEKIEENWLNMLRGRRTDVSDWTEGEDDD